MMYLVSSVSSALMSPIAADSRTSSTALGDEATSNINEILENLYNPPIEDQDVI